MAIAFTYLPNWSNTDHANVVVKTGGVFNLEDASLRPGVRVTVINTDHTTAVTITAHGSQTIAGTGAGPATTQTLASPSAVGLNTSITLLSVSTGWVMVSSH